MTHRMLTLPLIAVAVIGLSACSSQNPGNPAASSSTPATATTGGATSTADPLASVDPCTLVTQHMLTTNQWQPGQSVTAPGGRACRWERPDDGTTIDGYVFQLAIYNNSSVDQLETSGGTTSDYSVGKYQGKLFQDNSANTCTVSLATSNTSRVDVDIISRLGIDQGCKLVKQVAPLVVSNFPAGS